MRTSTIKITLGGHDYDVPRLNLGELDKVMELAEGPKRSFGYGLICIALKRAEPKVEDASTLEATVDEIGAAVKAIMRNSGMDIDGAEAAK